MKKIFILVILFASTITFLIAQKVELAYSFPFSDSIPFYENFEPNEGWSCGISIRIVEGNVFYLQDSSSGDYFICEQDRTPVRYISDHAYVDLKNTRLPFSKNHLFYTHADRYFTNESRNYIFSGIINGKPVTFSDVVNIDPNNYYVYFSGNILFIESKQTHQMESIEFLPDGSYKIRNASETESWLKSGKGEELGWSQEIYKGQVLTNYFGDNDLSHIKDSYKIAVLDSNVTEDVKDGYEKLWSSNYGNFAKDGKGLIYFRRMKTDNGRYRSNQPSKNIVFEIAILDPWTKQVRYYEDYGPNVFNPPRDADEYIIGSYNWTVAPDGNIYFTDADVEKGEYQIKRVINRWWDDMGINDRIIGQMNTNHIPLLTAMNDSQNDGYCFENDFVWVTEQTKDKKWSKIKKIDGREGWVETKYIDINTMVPVTNASL